MMISNSWFYPVNQSIPHDLRFDNMDLSWLHSFKNNHNVFYLVNIQSSRSLEIPDNKDLYILGWFFEPFDENWFMNIYNRNPQAEFVLLLDLYPNDLLKLNRAKIYGLCHHSTWFKAIRQMNTGPAKLPLSQRQYKISALSSRLSEFKFFITSKLLDKTDESIFFTWNLGFEIKDADNFIFNHTRYKYIDLLIDRYKETLRNGPIHPQKWVNSPLENCWFGHDAYESTIINCLNETQSLSFTPEFGLLPLPYLTEKTWKPLFAGNAVLFSTQAYAKRRLEELGFQFNYPWAMNFDDEVQDMHRYNTVLNHIDWILSLDNDTLVDLCKDSVQHNIDLAWSDRLDTRIRDHNQSTMQLLHEYLGPR